jgi:hypothetical protein
MVELLSIEAANEGVALSDRDKKILASEVIPGAPISEELGNKTKRLIGEILKKEQTSDPVEDPKSFGNTLEWAGDPDYPNIVMLTEEVIRSGASLRGLPSPHGWGRVKDRFQLLGCGLSLVLAILLLVLIASFVFKFRQVRNYPDFAVTILWQVHPYCVRNPLAIHTVLSLEWQSDSRLHSAHLGLRAAQTRRPCQISW